MHLDGIQEGASGSEFWLGSRHKQAEDKERGMKRVLVIGQGGYGFDNPNALEIP
jgi:hypothetical protein